jgi:hypothetical protein
MADLDEFAMAKLAREMAMNIRNYKDIYADFSITEEDYYEISKNEFYERAKKQFALEWNSALSAAERVRLISASYAEEGLPAVGRRMLDPNEPFPGVLSAFKQLCQNAGIGDPKSEQKSTERFVITINIGDESKTYDKAIDADANANDLTLKLPVDNQ